MNVVIYRKRNLREAVTGKMAGRVGVWSCSHGRVVWNELCVQVCFHLAVGYLGSFLTHLGPPLPHLKNVNNSIYLALLLRSLREFAYSSRSTLPGTWCIVQVMTLIGNYS